MLKRVILSLFSLSLCYSSVFGQQSPREITGIVTNSQSEPIENALVYISAGPQTALTDERGRFSFMVPSNTLFDLVISHISYSKFDTTFHGSGELVIDIRMQSNARNLKAFELKETQKESGSDLRSTKVSTETIDQNGKGTLINALEYLPGINAINVGVGIAKPIIRGMSFNRVSVQADGVQQEGQQWGADHGIEIDQFGVEQIEVVRGPAVLKFGGDAIGGILRVLPNSIADSNSILFDSRKTYRSNNHHVGLSKSIKVRKNKWFLNARASWVDFGDYRVPSDDFEYNTFTLPITNETLKNTAGEERNFSAETGFIFKKGITRLKASNYLLRAGIFPGAMGIPRSYDLRDDANNRNIALPSQRVEHTKVVSRTLFTTGPSQGHEVILSYQRNSRNEFSEPHAHGTSRPLITNRALRLDLQTVDAKYNYNSFLNQTVELQVGGNFKYQNNAIGGFEFLIPEYQKSVVGAYGIITKKWSPYLTSNAGLRLNYATYRAQAAQVVMGLDVSGNELIQQRASAFQRDFQSWALSVGTNYKKEEHTLSVQVAKSYRIPSIAELASDGIHHGTFRHEQGQPSLKLEEAYQLDGSYGWHSHTWKVQINGFLHYFDNYLYLRPSNRFSNLPESGQLFEYTSSKAIFTGGELFTEKRLGSMIMRTTLEGVYSLNLETQLGLPFTPPPSSLTTIIYKYPLSQKWNLTASIGYRYGFEQNRVDRNEPVTPDYHVVQANLGAKGSFLKWNCIMQFGVQNALNNEYYIHTNRYRWINIPEQGRNFVVSLRMNRAWQR